MAILAIVKSSHFMAQSQLNWVDCSHFVAGINKLPASLTQIGKIKQYNYLKLIMKFKIIIFSLILFFSNITIGQNSVTYIKKQNSLTVEDTLKIQIERLTKEINNLNLAISVQSKKIKQLITKTEINRIEYFKDFIYPILLSIIAAIIFWFVFSYIPEKRRKRKIRPIINLDLGFICTELYFIFDLVLKPNDSSISNFNSKIIGNKLEQKDLKLGLQNKCWNETYLFDKNVSTLLIPIGKNLFDKAKEIDITTERLFSFSNFLSVEEILILEKIRKNLQVYALSDYNRNAVSVIGNVEYKPVDSSLGSINENIFELYELFTQFQKLIYKNSFIDFNIYINKVSYYLYSEQYTKCIIEINKSIIKYPKDKWLLDFYKFLCEYNSTDIEKSYKSLESILKKKINLLGLRNHLRELLNDIIIQKLIQKYYTINEIEELKLLLIKEEEWHKNYIKQAESLLLYYKNKTT